MSRLGRWLPWLTGIAALAVLVAAVLHVSEERAFLRLLEQAQVAWLIAAVVLQLATYPAQAQVWRLVLRRSGCALPLMYAWRLSLAKLFVDQAIPSMGLSGAALVTHGLSRRGTPRAVVMSAVAVDAASFYLAYVANLAVALALLIQEGHATTLVLLLAACFASFAGLLVTAVLKLSGRESRGQLAWIARVPGLGQLVEVLRQASPQVAHDPVVLLRSSALQVAIALLDAATLWTLLRAVGVDASPGAVFASFMLASVLRSVGFLPGGIGTFEAGAVGALAMAGIPAAAALSATLLFRVLSFWLPMAPGLLSARALGETTPGHDAVKPPDAYWSSDPAQLMRQLDTAADGLGAAEAARRLQACGPNVVDGGDRLTRLAVLWNQLRSPLLLLLLFAAVVSAITAEWADAAIVIVIVLASVAIGYSREYKSQVAAARLSARVQVHAKILRDGDVRAVPVSEVVPGDVALLAAGSIVPGDSVVLESTDCYVNEAVLTGESFPVRKSPGQVPSDASLAARTNCLHLGTSVRSGTARCLVVATGEATSYGAVAHRLSLRPPETEFDRGVRHFGYLLSVAMSVMLLVVLAANLVLHRPFVETLLFAVALAVGLSPELLPAILSVNLARGAHAMSLGGVLVRRLSAIENLGSMDVLCTDKTGTLTEGVVRLDGAWDERGVASDGVLELAAWNALLQSGLSNPLDEAILQRRRPVDPGVAKLGEVPYDFVRKRLSVVLRRRDGSCVMATKGAFEPMLAVCSRTRSGVELGDAARADLRSRAAEWAVQGIRVLAVATRELDARATVGRDDERDLVFEGYLTFRDQPKAGVDEAVRELQRLGVTIKVITGDVGPVAKNVATSVGLRSDRVLTGAQVDALADVDLNGRVSDTDLFVEVDPAQKERIIVALRRGGHVVGFLGDGINDAPAMHAADTSLSVEGAVDVARQAADFVLLERDLGVIRRGIEEGRRTFANTLKYVMTTTSANLGNMISMALASLFLPFLPLLAGQVLLNNFLSDVPAIGLANDQVDREMLDRPRRWSMRFLARFMLEFGCLSSLFDFLAFALLLLVFAAPVDLFRTGWFVESLLTELAVALVVRTRRPFWRSRPAPLLLWSSVAVALLAYAIPFVPDAAALGFVPLPLTLAVALTLLTVAYVAAAEALKAGFYRRSTGEA